MHIGEEVRLYEVGDEKDACLFYFCSNDFEHGGDQGEVIRLSVDYNHALDCARGDYEADTSVVSWKSHHGGN